jgi:hypothetical protein
MFVSPSLAPPADVAVAFLFCGMFVSPDDVIWPFRLFTYIMPLQ